MKQILIISDSHRDDDKLIDVLNRYSNYTIIHAGDSCLEVNDPLLKDVYCVIGNHDFEPFPEYIILKPYMICHGHTFRVYHTFDRMIEIAKENECHTIIHGHTHIPYDQTHDEIRIINPGSLMINRGSYGFGTYVILNPENQELHFYHHETHEIVDDIVIEDGLKTFNEFKNLIKQFNL